MPESNHGASVSRSSEPTPTSVKASGARSVSVGGDLGLVVTGDNNVVNHYLIFGNSEHGIGPSPSPKIKAVAPVLVGLINWIGQAKSVHPGRRLVQSYVEQALREVGGPNVVGYGEEQSDNQILLLFTGASDLIELGAVLLSKLDRMMSEDWADIRHQPGHPLPQLRLVLHSGFGEYDGSCISSPNLVKTIRAHARTTALNDAGAGDAVGVVALVTNEAYDAAIYDYICGSGHQWIPFSQHIGDVSPLGFWSRGAPGTAATVERWIRDVIE